MKDRRGDMIGSLFPKAELFNQPEVLDFMNSLPQTFAEAENSLSLNRRYVNDNILQNRIKLAPFIRKFHSEAGTLHDGIQDQLASLSDPATQLFVSTHQPNLF